MIRYIIDASAAVEYLLRTSLGLHIATIIKDTALLAPALLDVEVLSVLRRGLLRETLTERRAELALEDLRTWQIDRLSHTALLRLAWEHRHNVSAYDAFYIAAAQLADAPVLTADGPLSRPPLAGIVVQNVRSG